MLNRRDFIKGAAAGFLAVNTLGIFPEKVFAADNLSVKTRYGTFNGFLDKNGVKTWLGIPFAKPPVKNLRWQAPQKLSPTNKTFDAKKFGFKPIQNSDPIVDSADVQQSEDCLTLNIWKKSDKKNLPVMVFIHGGAFAFESSSDALYNGSNFVAENDVILVSIEYRLNIFGFMNFGAIDKNFSDSGYLGLKDQIAALEWVKENISEFGGNPENITIFGESAGSIAVMLLTVTPAAKNLFQKVICQSGSVTFYNNPKKTAELAEMFMEKSGAKNVGELIKKSTGELKNIYENFSEMRGLSLMDCFPTCDGKFLPENPLQALKNGAAREIKFLTGTTSDEWRCFLLATEKFFELYRSEPEKNSPIFSMPKTHNLQEIYQKWLKNRPDNYDNFADFSTQLDWRVSQEISAEYQSQFNDVYFYLFSEWSPVENLRACHAVDLPFTFNNADVLYPNPPQNLVKAVQKSWIAFAATGNPDNEFIPHWEKYSANNRQTMELNSKNCILHKNLNVENLSALRYVYEE